MFSDPKAKACTPCGDNIASEPRDLDENPKAANGSLVRATSASCCEYRVYLAVRQLWLLLSRGWRPGTLHACGSACQQAVVPIHSQHRVFGARQSAVY
jgi:hypothetical protein